VRACVAATLIALGSVSVGWGSSESDRLHYLAVNGDGVLSSARAEEPVNPASVVKVATTLWALDRLGADHRYTTTVGYVGEWNRSTGALVGDLVIGGGDDPDFQWENAFLVARELNRLGLVRVEGRVRIQSRFWLGWEHGVEKRATDPRRLAEKMGRRLIAALDSHRWTRSHRNTWNAMCERRGWDAARRPRVVVTGEASISPSADSAPLLIHRSNPLAVIMRRFDVYSNNDIVRVADGLGTVAELQTFINQRLEIETDGIELETPSGERRNRMTVEQMVALLTELEVEAVSQDLELGQLLPRIGCDPGSTRRMFPALAGPDLAGSVTCKTGTLTHTDGGVVVLAGTFTSPTKGPVVFAIAAPEARGRIDDWRRVQQRWVLDLMDRLGGAVRWPCGPSLPFSDADAEIEAIAGAGE
jgi:D-alanyl-D-alanine carboxypeptidase/D-alanyl-D-alanine-endopeptidase (penicillin-binding protein 4)